MPINRFLSDITITPEQRHVIELAFASTLRKLHLMDRNDPICEIVAARMIDIHNRGVTNAVALTELTIREIGQSPERSFSRS
jgi:hypothetical protein